MSVVNVENELDLKSADGAGLKISKATANKLAFHGSTPIVQASAPTAAIATITHTAPSSDDFAWADVTTTNPYGLADQDEANSVLKAIRINQLRIGEIVTALQNKGIMA